MIRKEIKDYALKLAGSAEEALKLPKAVEGEEYGFACYIYTPGEKQVSSAWQEVKIKCLPDAEPEELMVILKSILPLYGQNDSFRGRTGPCGDYEDIECPLKYIYGDVWYCVKQKIEKMSFEEMKQVPGAWLEADFPSFITNYNDEYSLLPSQCWMNDYDIEWPPDNSPEFEKAEFALNILIRKAPKSAVKIDRIYSVMNNSKESVFKKYMAELYRGVKTEQDLWTLETIMELTFPVFQRTDGKTGKDIIERFTDSKLFYTNVLNQYIPSDSTFFSLMKQVPYNYEFLLSMPDEILFKAMTGYWDTLAVKLADNTGVKNDVYYIGKILFFTAGYRGADYNSFFEALLKTLHSNPGLKSETISNAVEKILAKSKLFPADETDWQRLLEAALNPETDQTGS